VMSGTSPAQEPLAINQHPGDHSAGHQPIAIVGRHHLEPEEAAVQVVKPGRNANGLADRKCHEVLELDAGADCGALGRKTGVAQSRDARSLSERQEARSGQQRNVATSDSRSSVVGRDDMDQSSLQSHLERHGASVGPSGH
jgi:hypothetical protein